MLAVAVHGHSIADVREQIVASICAEPSALKVSLEDLKDWVVLGTLRAVKDSVLEGALVEAGGTELVSGHQRRNLGREDTAVDVAGALIGAENVLSFNKYLIQLVDHATLQGAPIIELFKQ